MKNDLIQLEILYEGEGELIVSASQISHFSVCNSFGIKCTKLDIKPTTILKNCKSYYVSEMPTEIEKLIKVAEKDSQFEDLKKSKSSKFNIGDIIASNNAELKIGIFVYIDENEDFELKVMESDGRKNGYTESLAVHPSQEKINNFISELSKNLEIK